MRRIDIALTLAVTGVWGLAFVGLKEVLESAPPLATGGARFVLAGTLLLPFAVRRNGGRGRRPTKREILALALLQTTGLYGLASLGVQRATAGASALLVNTNPLMVALLAVPLLGETLTMRAALGIAVAIAGVAIVSVNSSLGSPLGISLLLASALCWAGASVAVKRLGAVDLVQLACGQMIVGGLLLLVIGIPGEHRLPDVSGGWLAWYAFLVIFASAVNFVVWFQLLERYSAAAMTSWLFLSPLFGVISGALLLDEPVGWRLIVGGGLVVAGIRMAQDQAAREEVVIQAGA